MQWFGKSSVFTQVHCFGSFKSTLTKLHATHHSIYLIRPSQEHFESHSAPPNHVGDAVPTVLKSWIKKRQSLRKPADVCFSTTFGSTFSVSALGWSRAVVQEGRWSRDRSLGLKWLTIFFPTSGIPTSLFFNSVDVALQVTSPKAHSLSRAFPGGSAFAACTRTLHC